MWSFWSWCGPVEKSAIGGGCVTELGTRNWDIAMTGLTVLLFRVMWNNLGIWTRKAIGHFKWGLIVHPSRSMEDRGSEGDSNCGDPAQEVSEGKNEIILGMFWQRIWLLFALVQNVDLRLH